MVLNHRDCLNNLEGILFSSNDVDKVAKKKDTLLKLYIKNIKD